jgi:hypothetical protein
MRDRFVCLAAIAWMAAANWPAVPAFAEDSARSAHAPASPKWTPPKTPWGDPDLQGVWTSDDTYGVPFERPEKFGTRRTLTEQERQQREKENALIQSGIEEGFRPNAGFFATQKGVDAAAVPPNWLEYAKHTSWQTSLILDPPNGRLPALTEDGKARRAKMPNYFNMRPASWEDMTMYDRCISRGPTGSITPAIYGNGTQIVQAPGVVAIRNEMIHETRLVPLDGRPHAGAGMRTYMGDPRGHWEGNALVVESTNFIGGRLSAGGGVSFSEELKLVERFTRISDDAVQYEATINDPKTYTAPFTISFPLAHEAGYQIFEYACHEGNYAMRNRLSAARAEEKAEAEKAAGAGKTAQ